MNENATGRMESAAIATRKRDVGGVFAINLTPVERVLQRSSLIGIGEFRCPVEHPQFLGGGPQTCPYIVFPRTSVRLTPEHWRSEICTPNVVSLHNVGDTYDRHPVSLEGDQSDWIAVSPELLRDIAIPYVEGRHAEANHIFQQPFAPMAPKIYLAQRALFLATQNDSELPILAVEEYVINLVEAVLQSATRYWDRPSRPAKQMDAVSMRRQWTIADEAKTIMALQYWEPLSVAQIAQHVHCSPGYLCRTFKRVTGFTLHGYLQQLRLRASLQLLADSWMDFAGIAEHLGFATHSHFTDVFRRQFGITPTEFMQRRSKRLLQTLSQMPSLLQATV
ncbi:MAG: AraC family transcriptional regulator [Dokdonella sp.]